MCLYKLRPCTVTIICLQRDDPVVIIPLCGEKSLSVKISMFFRRLKFLDGFLISFDYISVFCLVLQCIYIIFTVEICLKCIKKFVRLKLYPHWSPLFPVFDYFNVLFVMSCFAFMLFVYFYEQGVVLTKFFCLFQRLET